MAVLTASPPCVVGGVRELCSIGERREVSIRPPELGEGLDGTGAYLIGVLWGARYVSGVWDVGNMAW